MKTEAEVRAMLSNWRTQLGAADSDLQRDFCRLVITVINEVLEQ